MIHTLEIVQEVSTVELGALAEGFSFSQQTIRSMLFGSKRFITEHVSFGRRFAGFHSIRLSRIHVEGENYYYALVRLEPQALLSGQRTIDLFRATPDNVENLKTAFHVLMNHFIDDRFSNLVNLSAWKCQRIDYTANLRFDSPAQADLFLELSRQSSRYIRRHVKCIHEISDSEQSTAEGNQSTKAAFYNKKRQVQNTYRNIEQRHYERLCSEAENIVRFEYQCKRPKVQHLKTRNDFDSRGIDHYLNEDLASSLLLKTYEECVGRGDFYKVSEINDRIDASDMRQTTKDRLKGFIRLVAGSRPRGLYKAKELFMDNASAGNRRIGGTAETFNHRCKSLRELGIHPLPIPRDRILDYLENPVGQIENPR